jgi:outer membrane protein assembly factor BamB
MMDGRKASRFPAVVLAAAVAVAGWPQSLPAQWGGMFPSSQFELSDAVQLDQADPAVRAQLDRVKPLLADRQWDEAVEILRQLAETSEGKLLAIAPHRFIGLRDWCQLRLAALPPEALKLYRSRIDPVARRWYEQGIAHRDSKMLQNIVDQAFASSYGDKALMALGEISLESGDFAAARWNWERIVPVHNPRVGTAAEHSVGAAVELPPQQNALPPAWPSYPDTHLDLASVRARLVLVSVLEGATERARGELAAYRKLHPDAQGRLGGREGRYIELLESLLAESVSWPVTPSNADWLTFAGNPQRNQTAGSLLDVGAVAWRVPLRPSAAAAGPMGAKTAGEDPREPLSFFPLLVGQHVLVNTDRQVLAVHCDSGQPAWGRTAAIYESEITTLADRPIFLAEGLGSPRFTTTVFRDRLFARMGSTVTGRPHGAGADRSGCLICLDLAAEGRLLWKIAPEEGWAFEGSPLADGRSVYVAMRRQDIRPQAFVACFDADTGRFRWRRFICGAETPARGVLPEQTHGLLTLSSDTLYYNTNLGAVAALRADDGRVLWISLYPRALRGDLAKLAPHWRRELNPCLLDRGTLLVAPADSPRIFAFDTATGQILWQTGTEVEDATSLLAAAGDWLIAGGARLYWISLKEEDRGRVKHVWPDGPERPGYGRGVLAGQDVLWSTRDKLYIFNRQTARPRRIIDLAALGASGGNLLVAYGKLLIATERELITLGTTGGRLSNGTLHNAN